MTTASAQSCWLTVEWFELIVAGRNGRRHDDPKNGHPPSPTTQYPGRSAYRSAATAASAFSPFHTWCIREGFANCSGLATYTVNETQLFSCLEGGGERLENIAGTKHKNNNKYTGFFLSRIISFAGTVRGSHATVRCPQVGAGWARARIWVVEALLCRCNILATSRPRWGG